ncbi:MAG: glycosyltransferase family 4 protein [Anaerolineales bacterium]
MKNGKPYERCVLFISDLDVWTMGQGAGGPALSRTLQAYAQDGWKVVFLTGSGKASGQEMPGVRIVRFGAPWLKRWFGIRRVGAITRAVWWIVFQIRATLLGIRLKRDYPFSIVYGYEIKGVPAAKLLSRLWHVPLVTRFQGSIIQPGGPRLWKKYLRAWDHWCALRMPADLVVMTDDGTQGDRNLQELGVDMQKVRFWMNGTDKEAFMNMPSHQDARSQLGLKYRNVILMVSRLVWWKCVDRGIKAFPQVLAACPETLLLIVGDGVEKSNLERLARNLGVVDHVRFVGTVAHQEIKTYLAAADIFLSLNTRSNVGNPLLEAMLAGKCIFTLATGDTSKVIKHGETGILLREEDLALLPKELISLLHDPERVATLGADAREYAQSSFLSWEERTSMEIEETTTLLRRSNPMQSRKVLSR